MTTYGKSPKIKRGKLEVDIERCRSECRWIRARDLVNTLRNERQTQTSNMLAAIVTAEIKLEKIMNEKDFISVDDAREIKSKLDEVLNGSDENYKLEAKILLGKLRFMQEKYKEAITSLENLNLKNIKIEHGQSRLTKLVAEAFAVVGLSYEALENQGSIGSGPLILNSDILDKILDNLDMAGDLGIFHLQQLEKTNNTGTSIQLDCVVLEDGTVSECSAIVTKILSKAIQQSPIIAIRHSRINAAIDRYRQLLRYQETETSKPLRQTLARQLAEVLLRGICQANYPLINISSANQSDVNTTQTNSSLSPSLAAMWRQPAIYQPPLSPSSIPNHHTIYTPHQLNQEILLLLLISEYLANQEAVLNRSPEHSDARIATLNNSQAVYDLLCISLSRLHCYPYLCQILQHALRFSYKEFHTWYQLGLALVSAKQYYAGYRALLECQRLDEQDNRQAAPILLSAGLAIEALGRIDEGIELAKTAIEVYSKQNKPALLSKSRLLVGRAYELLGKHKEALQETLKATEDDPQSYLAFYRLGLLLAGSRRISEALEACGSAVKLDGGQTPAPLHLLALLESSTGRIDDAIRVVEAALVEHSSDLGLLRTMARLQLVAASSGSEGHASSHGRKAALRAYRQVVEACRDYETTSLAAASNIMNCSSASSINNPNGATSVTGGGAGGVTTMNMTELALSCHMAAASIDNQVSCYYSSQEAVLGLTELYLDCGMLQEAEKCLDNLTRQQQRQQINGGSTTGSNLVTGCSLINAGGAFSSSSSQYYLLYLKARICQANNQDTDARKFYEQSLSINPSYVSAKQHLAQLLQQMKYYQLAEKLLRDCLTLDRNNCRSWQLLGELFTELVSIEFDMDDPVSNIMDNHRSIGGGEVGGLSNVNDMTIDIISGTSSSWTEEDFPLNSRQIILNNRQEMIEYATSCLTVASDLELSQPIESFFVLPRAVKYF